MGGLHQLIADAIHRLLQEGSAKVLESECEAKKRDHQRDVFTDW